MSAVPVEKYVTLSIFPYACVGHLCFLFIFLLCKFFLSLTCLDYIFELSHVRGHKLLCM